MHLEVLVEDSSGAALLNILLPRLIGEPGAPHTWRIVDYKGIGRLPPNLKASGDPAKRALLNQLPRLLAGYGRTPGMDAVLVVLDSDARDCEAFLKELQAVAAACQPAPKTLFRLAVEELEAWYLGDRHALTSAFPRVKADVLRKYRQDSVCGTWELLADAVVTGGAAAVRKKGWPLPGDLKHQWAKAIGPRMDMQANASPSFAKFRDGLRRLVAT